MLDPADSLIQLSAYIDNELDGLEAGRIRRQLAESPLLDEQFSQIKALCDMLTRWDEIDTRSVAVSTNYNSRLLERLHRLQAVERVRATRPPLTPVHRN